MPNWCYTDFTVSGPTEEVTRFREAVRGSDDSGETPFDFDRVIPMPSELLETTGDFGTAYQVYYGDAERILERPWVKKIGIGTVERCKNILTPIPSTARRPSNIRRTPKSTECQHGTNGVARTGAQNGTLLTPK